MSQRIRLLNTTRNRGKPAALNAGSSASGGISDILKAILNEIHGYSQHGAV